MESADIKGNGTSRNHKLGNMMSLASGKWRHQELRSLLIPNSSRTSMKMALAKLEGNGLVGLKLVLSNNSPKFLPPFSYSWWASYFFSEPCMMTVLQSKLEWQSNDSTTVAHGTWQHILVCGAESMLGPKTVCVLGNWQSETIYSTDYDIRQ